MKEMLVLGTEMNILTFSIVIVELGLFFFQFIYYLSRPSDKNRLWFLILLYLLLQYNIISGLLPDPDLFIPIYWQNILAYLSGFLMSIYFPFYIYKAFDLKPLRFFAYKGAFFFLFLPFIILIVIPYLITDDILLSRRIVILIPLLFLITFMFFLYRAVKSKYFADDSQQKEPLYKEKIIAIFLALIFWLSLPIVLLFERSNNFIEHMFTNAGLLVMTIIYIRSTIYNSKIEYQQLVQFNNELSEKVKERTRQLELINQQQSNTFINLAHETKTPLTLINNYLKLYEDKYGENDELNILKTHLNKLTKDIVNFFDLERFKRGFNVYDHNLISPFSSILKENIKIFEPYAISRKLSFDYKIEEGLYVKADPEALDRVINNLFENAIRYNSDKGTVEVTLWSEGKNILLSVKDSGSGIPVKVQHDIYNPYYQIVQEKKNTQGMGLGLSIVKQIMDDIGLDMKLISNPAEKPGTEFILSFIKEENVESAVTSFQKNANEISLNENIDVDDAITDQSRPYILIVEDNLSMLNFLVESLKQRFNIYVAENGKVALERLKSISHLDLIISDLMMDEMDGFDLYKSISQKENLSHIPFIFLTARTSYSDKLKGLKMGAVDYIHKPFMISELIEKIDSLLISFENQRKAMINTAYKSIMKGVKISQPSFEDICREYDLTKREMEIANLIIGGNTQKRIGEQLYISEKTVSKHIQNIYSKLQITNRVELVNKLKEY